MSQRAAPSAAWQYRVSLARIVSVMGLEVVHDGGGDLAQRYVTTADLSRPGLVWAGYTRHFDNERLQVVGPAEAGFLWSVPEQHRWELLGTYCQLGFPAVIITRGLEVPNEALATTARSGIPVLRTSERTSRFESWLNRFLSKELAPRALIHAGLVDVAGVGVLILGQSGMGKSETTMELIRRGHRLIADDTVEVRRPSEAELWGRSPDVQRHFMEIKGIGIVNVRNLFGVGAVKEISEISLVVSLERWRADADYSGYDQEVQTYDLLGIPVPLLPIPVEPGRNLAVVIEAAAMTHRARNLGTLAF
jgi:HPr kinase/phosphorylase